MADTDTGAEQTTGLVAPRPIRPGRARGVRGGTHGRGPVARRCPALQRTARAVGAALRGAVVRLLPAPGTGGLARPLSDYKAPNYWLHYGWGFVRRGLPGEVLRRAVGGPPTYRQVERAAVAVSRAAAVSVVPVAVRVGSRATGPLPRTAATALLLLSPLTCSLLLHDVGRYDGVGVLALALSALGRAAWLHLPLPVTAALLAVGVLVAVATEEFLLAVLAPTAVAAAGLVAQRHRLGRWRTALLLAGVLGPGAVTAGASLLTAAPREALLAARTQAADAGVRPPGAMGDALSALDRGFVENLAFFRLFRPAAVVGSFLLWSGLFAGTAAVLGRLLGGGAAYRWAAWAHGAVGAALSAAGVDFRRWWGLALLGLASTVALQEAPVRPEPAPPAVTAAAAALAVAGLRARNLHAHPWGPLRPDRALAAAF